MLIRVNDLDTHFTQSGEGNPVLLLHGWGASAESLANVAKTLADQFRVLAIDLPGFGWSPSPSSAWGTRDYATHVEAFMDRTGIPVASVLGHSFGGRIALALAARAPRRVRNLVLVASAGIRPRHGPGYFVKVGVAKLAKRFLSSPIPGRVGGRVASRVYERVGSRDYRSAGRMRATMVKVVKDDLRELLSSIGSPALIIWGDRDQEVPRSSMEIMARGIKGSRFVVLEGAGHFPFVDMPDRFGELVKDFLCES